MHRNHLWKPYRRYIGNITLPGCIVPRDRGQVLLAGRIKSPGRNKVIAGPEGILRISRDFLHGLIRVFLLTQT